MYRRELFASVFTLVLGFLMVGCGTSLTQLRHDCDVDEVSTKCLEAAQWYLDGKKDTPKDPEKALRYFGRACELGNSDGCALKQVIERLVAEFTGRPISRRQPSPPPAGTDETGGQGGGQLDPDKVRRAIVACDQGNSAACKAVLPIFLEGCKQKNEEACQALLVIMRKLCDLGEGEMCTMFVNLSAKMCDEGKVACACAEVGRMLLYPRPPIKPNRRAGIELLKVGCTNRCGDSCKILDDFGVSH